MSDYRLSVHLFYSDISDSTLEELRIQEEFPGCGNRHKQGHLISRGVRVQQHRVREAQRRTDPMGSVDLQQFVEGGTKWAVRVCFGTLMETTNSFGMYTDVTVPILVPCVML